MNKSNYLMKDGKNYDETPEQTMGNMADKSNMTLISYSLGEGQKVSYEAA